MFFFSLSISYPVFCSFHVHRTNSINKNENRSNNSDTYYPPPPIVEVIPANVSAVVSNRETLLDAQAFEEALGDAMPPEEAVVVENRPTPRATLGREIHKRLKEGKAASDRQLAKLVALKLKQLPPDGGWILVGFPRNLSQVHGWRCCCRCHLLRKMLR